MKVKINLPDDWCDEIDAQRGVLTVATFIREAIKEKLDCELSIPTRPGRPWPKAKEGTSDD